MTTASAYPQRLRVAHLNPQAANQFNIETDPSVCAEIATELGILDLNRLSFQGEVNAHGKDEWELTGQLNAQVVQSCVVTLKPVKTTLQGTVHRRYSPHFTQPDAEEIEMPDENLEPLGQFIDISAVMVEELALALPEYPRAKGAALDAPEEKSEPDTRRPFSGLGDLLRGKSDQE